MTKLGISLVFAIAFGVTIGNANAQQIIFETTPTDPLDVFPLCITKEQTESFVESNNWSVTQTSDETWTINETGVQLRFSDGKLIGFHQEMLGNLVHCII